MALKSKRPSVGAKRRGKKTTHPFLAVKTSPEQQQDLAVETIEARLARKAADADTTTFATPSLGQMTREKRHKLLYGD